jgi:hypothetical protein
MTVMAGVAFMITNAMKEALRSRGLTDDEIEKTTPAEAQKILLTADPRAVRACIQAIATQAKAAAGATAGLLQLSRLHPVSETLVPSRYTLDDIERMITAAISDCERGHNVYIEGRLVPGSLRGSERGKLADTVVVFALIIDSDADKGMGWTPPATIRPSMIAETSPGNFQFWFFLRVAIAPEPAQKLGERIREAVNSDHDTGNPTQPYRIAGTVNYPSAAKVARGRDTIWTRLIALDPNALWTPEELERAFPLSEQPRTNGGAPAQASSASEADIPADTMRVIRDGPTKGNAKDRSLAFWNVVMVLKELGFTVEGILELLERHPEGLAKKYEGRLRRETERAYDKIEIIDDAGQSVSTPATPPVPTSTPTSTPTGGAPTPLDDAHVTFKKWLGNDYDTDVLDAVLATAAAERLSGDPLCLMVISGPGNAKTETVRARVAGHQGCDLTAFDGR